MNNLPVPVARLVGLMLALAIVAYMTISAPLLTAMHIPYDAPEGSFIFKLHLGTYLLSLAFVLAHCARGNPLRSVFAMLGQHRLIAFYLGSGVFLLLYSVARYGPSGSAFIIDTLIMPAVAVSLLMMLPPAQRQRYFLLVMTVLTANAMIGIAESVLQTRLVPYTVAGGVVIKEDIFRSTALMGHPLNNALITGPLLMAALVLRISMFWRIVLMGVLFLGLLSFGGRTSFLTTALLLFCYLGVIAISHLLRGRYSYLHITGGLLVSFLLLAMLIGLVTATGLGERIFMHLAWDNSASIRLRVWQVFNYMGPTELIFGMSPADIQLVTVRLAIYYPLETIENFWLVMLMQMGLAGFLPFVAGLIAISRYIWLRSNTALRLALLLFFIIASSNNSLASKNSGLILLFVALTSAAAYAPRMAKPGARRLSTVRERLPAIL